MSSQQLSPSLHRVWHITREETRTHGAFDAVAASRTREEGSITNPYLVLCIAPVQGGGAVPLLILRKAFHSQLLTQTVVPLSSSHRLPPRARPRPPPVPPLAPPVRACRPFGSSVHGTTHSQSEESVHAAPKKATARNRGTGSTPKLMIPYRRAVQRTDVQFNVLFSRDWCVCLFHRVRRLPTTHPMRESRYPLLLLLLREKSPVRIHHT